MIDFFRLIEFQQRFGDEAASAQFLRQRAKLGQAFVWNLRTCALSRRRGERTSRKRL